MKNCQPIFLGRGLNAPSSRLRPLHQHLFATRNQSKQRCLNFALLRKAAKPAEVRKADKPNKSQNNASVVEISY